MSKFESSVKQIPYAQADVYRNLSDLNNLERLRSHMPADKVKDLTFDHDSVSVNAPMVGQVSVEIVEREEPKCVKLTSQQSPIPFKVWLQVLPTGEQSSKLKVTLDADIPLMLRPMVSGPLQEGVEKIADVLSSIEYV